MACCSLCDLVLIPYDGNEIGSVNNDRVQNATGTFYFMQLDSANNGGNLPCMGTGVFYPTGNGVGLVSPMTSTMTGRYSTVGFDLSRMIRTGHETAPVWLAVLYAISY